MKKRPVTLIFLALITFLSYAQQVSRDKVIVEIGTGTWCPYCPSAAMGAEDLLNNGYQVAVIKYHKNDDYANTYSNARIGYYSMPGIPTTYFDGLNPYVGGNGTTSNFPYYVPKVNQRMSVQSSFTIDVEGTHTCLTDFTANIEIEKVAPNSSTNLRLHTVLTESHIPEAWQNMDELNNVCRLMAPNQNGTAVSFDNGDLQEFNITFSVDPGWILEECEVVVFLQDQATREIYQGTKIPLLDFLPVYDYDAAVKSIIDLPKASCSGSFEPTVEIFNAGGVDMNSVDIYYSVNGSAPQSHTWTGSLTYLGTEQVALPPINFTGDEENELVVYTDNPNGHSDECQSNDDNSFTVPEAMHTPNTVKLYLRTDDNPGETTWDLKNSAGEILYQGGPYLTAGEVIQQTFDLTDEDCFTFTIYDSGGDGFILPGLSILYYGASHYILQSLDFGFKESTDFNTTDIVGIDETKGQASVRIFPNPIKDKANVVISLDEPSVATIKLYSLTGQLIYEDVTGMMQKGQNNFVLDGSSWRPGLYLYQLMAGDQIFTGKLTVN